MGGEDDIEVTDLVYLCLSREVRYRKVMKSSSYDDDRPQKMIYEMLSRHYPVYFIKQGRFQLV